LGYDWDGAYFFDDFVLDHQLASRTESLTIFNSDNDKEGIHRAVNEIRATVVDIKYREFHLGHFTVGSMKTTKFPELLEALL